MKMASSTLRKCSSPVTTFPERVLAVDRIIKSAKLQPLALSRSSSMILPVSAAVSKFKLIILLVDLMNSRSCCRPSWVSFPIRICWLSFLLISETTIVGVVEYSLSIYSLAISPSFEALKYSIQA